MNTLSETDKAYLAGLMDGEGCIFISKYQGKDNRSPVYSLRVIITLTDQELIEKWQAKTGVGVVFYDPARSKRSEKWSDAWQWIVTAQKDARDFLEAIHPYLCLKQEQADTALDFLKVEITHCGRYVTTPQYITDQREHYRVRLMNQKTHGRRQPVVVPDLPDTRNVAVQGSLF